MLARHMRAFAADQAGATAVEYGLLIAAISLALLVSFGLVGNNIQNLFTSGGGAAIAEQAAIIK